MNRQHIMAAMIHDQVGQTLVKILQGAGRDNPFQIRLGPNETLLGQLAAPGDGPPRISVGFGLDIVDGSVSALLDRLPVPDAGLFARLSSMAESAAMRAVEVGTQGVSEFQTNPLIAASSGSFAGTVARKLAQDSFLDLLTADLKRRPAARPR